MDVLGDKLRQFRVIEEAENFAQHVDFLGDVLGAGVQVERFRLQLLVDLGEETLSLLEEGLLVDFHNHGRVDVAKSGLAHQGTLGLVVGVVGVSQGLVDMDIGGDARLQFSGASAVNGFQVEVLDGLTLGGFSLITERLGDQLVDGLDALDDELSLLVGATDDADSVDTLKMFGPTIFIAFDSKFKYY